MTRVETSRSLTDRVRKLYGIELFPGIGTPLSRTTRYGAVFAAAERGKTPLILAGWVNYTPIFFKPDTECTVVGGRWCLVEGGYDSPFAMLYGSLSRGTIAWNGDGKLALLSVCLEVSGGTGAYHRFRGTAELTGALNHHPFPPSPPRIGATLRFMRQAEQPASAMAANLNEGLTSR